MGTWLLTVVDTYERFRAVIAAWLNASQISEHVCQWCSIKLGRSQGPDAALCANIHLPMLFFNKRQRNIMDDLTFPDSRLDATHN